MTGLPSIQQRLSRSLVVISLAWGLAVSLVVWVEVRIQVDDLLDHALQESAEILYGLLSFNASQLPMAGGGALPAPKHNEELVWQIVNAGNEVALRSHEAPLQPLLEPGQLGLATVGDTWRVYGMDFGSNGRRLYVAQRGDDRRESQTEAAGLAVLATLLVSLVCGLWLRHRVRRELQPIVEMSNAVKAFDPSHPDLQLAPATRAELVPMHDAIDELGARLSNRLDNERAFSAHAAHALRTPLAGMVAQLAAAQRRSPPEAQGHLARVREAADRLRRVVTALLTLFRTGSDATWQRVDLNDLAAQLTFESLTVAIDASTPLDADPDLIAAALMNLLDNSVRHGATQVTLSTRAEPSGTHLRVQDNGQGIPEPERRRLQLALDTQGYEGQMGLGLMLADLVARAHGGRIHLLPSELGCAVDIALGHPPAQRTAGGGAGKAGVGLRGSRMFGALRR